jgi:uncharacterized RDD family membrane protein YckC
MTEPTPPTVEPTPSTVEPVPTAPDVGWTAPDPTPGPAPGVEFADPGPRLIGYIIDILINAGIVIALTVVGVILAAVLPILAILPFIGVVVIPFIYFPYFWSRGGQTPGMKQMGIRVVRDADGGPVSTGQAILRLVGYWVSGFVFYLGYIWILIDKRRRGWFDLIAGTVVVKA